MSHREATILIVDDDAKYLHALAQIIGKEKYKTKTVDNGRAAVQATLELMPDLILLDVIMPEMDGFETCKKLKANKRTKDIPVIFLTARVDVEDIIYGFEVGAVDYVTKPFNSAELLARIKTHVELKRAREEIRTLRGIVPVCANCKKIRNDGGAWQEMEVYIVQHSEADFSHSLCPDCVSEIYPQFSEKK